MKKFVVFVAALLAPLFAIVPAHAGTVSPNSTGGGSGSPDVTFAQYDAIQTGWTKFHVEQTDFGGITGGVTDTCSNGDQYKRYAALWSSTERYVWVLYEPSDGKWLVVQKGTMPFGVTIKCGN